MDWRGKAALITGASSGIGAATARKLAREGLRVILVARREERLKELAAEIAGAGGQASVIVADLTEEKERRRVYEAARAACGVLDVLVNNAGIGWYGYGAEMSWQTAHRMLEVNAAAVAHLTLLFLPEMRARGSGHIVNIGSVAGSLPSQGVAIYCATKSFVDSFTTALYREMRGTHVHVSVVKPGPVTTEFFDSSNARSNGRYMPAERFGVKPQAVAEAIWAVLNRPSRVVYVPRLLSVAPWVELYLGWLMDLLGPLLLRRAQPAVEP